MTSLLAYQLCLGKGTWVLVPKSVVLRVILQSLSGRLIPWTSSWTPDYCIAALVGHTVFYGYQFAANRAREKDRREKPSYISRPSQQVTNMYNVDATPSAGRVQLI